jgi:hypothetical protein
VLLARVSCAAAYGEVWLADLGVAAKTRPAMILSRRSSARTGHFVVVNSIMACEQKDGGAKEESSSNADWIGERTDQWREYGYD